MKRLIGIFFCMAAVVSLSLPTMAASWQNDAEGWRWMNDDGSWPVCEWVWLDDNQDGISERYYFDENGHRLANTVTPDGSTVDADGKWTVDGQIQTWQILAPSEIATKGYKDKISNIIWDIMDHTGKENEQLLGIPSSKVSMYTYPVYPYLQVLYELSENNIVYGDVSQNTPYIITMSSNDIAFNQIFTDAPDMSSCSSLENIADHLRRLGYEVQEGHSVTYSANRIIYIKLGRFEIGFDDNDDGTFDMRIKQPMSQQVQEEYNSLLFTLLPKPDLP